MAPEELSHDRGRKKNRGQLQPQTAGYAASQGSRWAFQRPPAPAAELVVKVDSPMEERTLKVEKRQSKMSLFSLFAPPKVERSRGYTETGLEAISERQPSPHTSIGSRPVSRAPSSLSFMRSDESDARQGLASRASSIRTTVSSLDGWDPPPLFQAYPQAIKYATLQASTVSTEVLQKAQGHKRQLSHLQEQFESSVNLSLNTEDISVIQSPAKTERSTLSKKRYSTANSGGAPLASKVYVLVTSGYLLQYSGEGPSNRMPEKILPLDRDSAAFASDLIPGKHFVLEVRQAINDNGGALAAFQPQSRSLLKRLRSQPQLVKRSTNTMLLVLDSADEMVSWMKAVRRVIDDKNGRGHKPSPSTESKRDSGHSTDGGSRDLPSHRYRVQRQANAYDASLKSNDNSPAMSRAPSVGPSPGPRTSISEVERDLEAVRTRGSSRSRVHPSEGGSAPPPPSPPKTAPHANVRESFATTVSTVSQDQFRLDRLRDSRQSFLSNRTSATGNVTLTTSSGPPSPSEESSDVNLPQNTATFRSGYTVVNNTIGGSRRKSFQRLPATTELPNAGLPDGLRPLATLRSSSSETNIHSIIKPPSEHNLRRLSSLTPRMRVSIGSSLRSQSVLDQRRPSDHRASTISAVSNRTSASVIDDQQSELEAATEAAAEIESMVTPEPRRVSTLGALPNLSSHSLLSLHRQQQMQEKDRIPASVRNKYKAASPTRPTESLQQAATEIQLLMNPGEGRATGLTTQSNLSSHSLSSLHKQQQAQDKERIPVGLREKYLARRKERHPPAPAHVRSPEEEAAAAQLQALMNPDERPQVRPGTQAPEDMAFQLPLVVQYKQQQAQDKERVPAAVREKFQNAAAGRISESEERIDQQEAAAQIQSIMDPEDRPSSSLGGHARLPSQSLQAMYKSQQNQDKTRIPAELRHKYQSAANARQAAVSEDIDQNAAAAQIQAIMDPNARSATRLSMPAKPAVQSLHTMHQNQVSQDKNRIPTTTRKKYQRPIPIRVSNPALNGDKPSPIASPVSEQPIIPKRMSSLPSPRPRLLPNGTLAVPPTSPGLPPSPNIAHFPQPPKRMSQSPGSFMTEPGSSHTSPISASASPMSGYNDISPTIPFLTNQSSSADTSVNQGLRRPASLQVRASPAAFLSSRPQPNSGARRSFTPTNATSTTRPASAQAGRTSRNGRASPGPATALAGLETVGEARVLRAMGPSDPLKQASERLALRSGLKRAPSPIGVKVRVSMPAVGINGPPVRIEPMLPMSINLANLPAAPGPPPSCALPAVPGPPPSRGLPTIPGSASTSLRSTPTPTPQTVHG